MPLPLDLVLRQPMDLALGLALVLTARSLVLLPRLASLPLVCWAQLVSWLLL